MWAKGTGKLNDFVKVFAANDGLTVDELLVWFGVETSLALMFKCSEFPVIFFGDNCYQ
jgi:hypothetical protein